MRWLSALALCAALAGPCRAEDLTQFAYDPHPGAAVPVDAALADEAGRATSLRALAAGRPLILALGYFRCPNLCGVVRDDVFSALSRARLEAGRDYALVALSIDPAEGPRDAAQAKAEDLARYPAPGAEAFWRFATGPEGSVAAIAAAVGFRFRFDPALKQFVHPAGLVLVTPGGIVSRYLLGVGYAPADLEQGVAAAARGDLAAAAQPVLLLCFHYDAATGRYTLAVMKLLRLAAALTVLAVGGVLLAAHRPWRRA